MWVNLFIHSFIILFRVDIIYKSIVVKLIKIDVFGMYVSANPWIPPGSSEPGRYQDKEEPIYRPIQTPLGHPHQSEDELVQ